jgi:hypothetical protein
MPAIVDGDRRFQAVDERQGPDTIPAGTLSRAINCDLDEGEIKTRKGFYAHPGHTAGGFRFPFDFALNFDEGVGHGKVYGAVPYTSEFGEDYFVLALPKYALRIHDSGSIVTIYYPLKPRDNQVEEVDEKVEMVQAYNKLYMFRGRSKDPWVWDGEEIGKPSFVAVQRTNLEPGVEPMPRSKLAIYYLNRLWVLSGKDEIYYSDIGVETDFNLTNSFKIDSGSFDSVVGMKAWGDNAILVFKEKSLDVLENLQGDLTLNGSRTRLSGEIGLASPSCITDVGRDCWFLSERGVFSVSQALDNKLQSNAEPLSAPLEPLFRRINWNVKEQFRSAFWENTYYLAVALDDSKTNNCIIKYSFITKSWHGYDTSDHLDAERMFVNFQNAEKYLFYITTKGRIYRMYVGNEDEGTEMNEWQRFTTNEPDFSKEATAIGGFTYKITYDGTETTTTFDETTTGTAFITGLETITALTGNVRFKGGNPATALFSNGGNEVYDIEFHNGLAGTDVKPLKITSLSLNDGTNAPLSLKQEIAGRMPITSTAITRGYGAAELDRKQFREVAVDISTICPSYTLSVLPDGVNEEDNLLPAPTTKNNLKYYTTGTPQYTIDNTNDDHGNAYREDYSVIFAGLGFDFPFDFDLDFQEGKTANETYELTLGDNGVNPDLMQRIEDRRATNQRGDYMRVKIVNTDGRMRVHSIKTKGFTHNRTATISA